MPARLLSLASRMALNSSEDMLPLPTSTRVPTILRTMCLRKELASTVKMIHLPPRPLTVHRKISRSLDRHMLPAP